ncbi:MAG: galactose oxidase-like domain-containing protein [Ramlibacter sp.]
MTLVARFSRLLACAAIACGALGPLPAVANSTVGAWQTLNALPFFPVHAHLLPSGLVMIWPGDYGISGDAARLFDPATQNLTLVPTVGYDIFCSGHAFLTDGTMLVAGGHISNDVGLARASRYLPATNSWAAVPDMNAGRWYPTVTTLGNGDALVTSGSIDLTIGVNQLPQVYQAATNSWRNLSTAQLSTQLYPMMFLAPDGRVVMVGPEQLTRWLNTSGTGTWTSGPSGNFGFRYYGSAAMYADGKVLIVGGGDPPTNTAEVIDLNQPSPTWRNVGSMSVPRQQPNATILPDGKVLVTGGTSGAGFSNPNTPVYLAEIWDPATGAFTPMASALVPRLYHSSALLLPDGRVLTMGGNDQMVPELFSPPYLFKGARPTITSAPTAIGYGQHFTVQTPNTGISKVTLIRLGSVTHAFNENQRLNVLPFTAGTGSLDITAPASGNNAPPGHYMLFIVDGNGVPSVGQIVQLSGTVQPPATAAASVTSLAPNSAIAGGAAFTLTVTGTGFVSGATVNWNGAARTTTFGSATRLSAQIPATDIAAAGTANVAVVNPGTAPSNAVPFTVATGYRLTVTKAGSDAARGTVTSTPAGISCGSTCSAPFATGASVALTATAVGNVQFTGWSGACTGTGACTVPMTSDKGVTATFVRR